MKLDPLVDTRGESSSHYHLKVDVSSMSHQQSCHLTEEGEEREEREEREEG